MSRNNIKNHTIHVFIDQIQHRVIYTINFIFRCVLQQEVQIYYNIHDFQQSQGIRLVYSQLNLDINHFKITPSGLLAEKEIHPLELHLQKKEDLYYFQYHHLKNFDADPLSDIFFLISRYEEYLPSERDIHDRFIATKSVLYQNELLEFPFVDASIEWIRKELNHKFQTYFIPKPSYHFIPTYDIDYARAYLWKNYSRNIGSWAKNLVGKGYGSLSERIAVFKGQQKDPFDTFDYLSHLDSQYNFESIFFWLLGDFGQYDNNTSHQHPKFRQLIQGMSSTHSSGIHPSYASYLDTGKIEEEINRLKDIIQKPVIRNRFHFLRIRFPESYQILCDLGIQEDYSMGFARSIGFRAGTAHPFYWYDLKNEQVSALKVFPFQVMELTLKEYMQLDIGTAKERILQIQQNIQKYGGQFMTLWHNSSFHLPEWKEWKNLYEWIFEQNSL